MPELPEIDAYVAAAEHHVSGQVLEAVRLASPFLLRTVEPPMDAAVGRRLVGAERIGKRVALVFEGELAFVIHLMIAGRLRWTPLQDGKPRPALKGKAALLALDFEGGTLVMTEQGSKRRASLHVTGTAEERGAHDPGGIEPLTCTFEAFRDRLVPSGHTLKRALTSPRILSGVGNAWSDEILFRARMSPSTRAATLDEEQARQLFDATRAILTEAKERAETRARAAFPDRVTAFQPEMAVHGRYGEPCVVCGAPIQRVTRAAGHDFHYCAACQNGGKILADRALSRLLKDSWPKRLEDLEG